MSNNTGFLVPDRYVFHVPSDADMNTSSIFWGFSLGAAFFSALRAGSQSVQLWRRKGRVTAYVAMIWVEWIASVVIGVIAWCFQRQYIKARFVDVRDSFPAIGVHGLLTMHLAFSSFSAHVWLLKSH